MKNTFFISALLLCFFFFNQTGYAQENTDAKKDPIKEKFVKAYDWTKAHFENTAKPIVSMKQMQTVEGHEYVLIETEATKTLFDKSGKQYCTDHSELNCVEFYKLSAGDLIWKKS